MGNPASIRRIKNCLNTVIKSYTKSSCYKINEVSDELIKQPVYEHLKLYHYEIIKDQQNQQFNIHLLLETNEYVSVKIPYQSETFSYGPWEFGFEWYENQNRKSVSFSLDSKSADWESVNSRKKKLDSKK